MNKKTTEEPVSKFKATTQQIFVGVATAIFIGIISFGTGSYIGLQEKVEQNREDIQTIQQSIPKSPLQVVINEAVKGEIKTLSKNLDSIIITEGSSKLEQQLLLDDMKEDLIKIKFMLEIE